MKWLFFLFRKITELELEIEGKRLKKVLNLNKKQLKCSDKWKKNIMCEK